VYTCLDGHTLSGQWYDRMAEAAPTELEEMPRLPHEPASVDAPQLTEEAWCQQMIDQAGSTSVSKWVVPLL
jgi:hypothetical protein